MLKWHDFFSLLQVQICSNRDLRSHLCLHWQHPASLIHTCIIRVPSPTLPTHPALESEVSAWLACPPPAATTPICRLHIQATRTRTSRPTPRRITCTMALDPAPTSSRWFRPAARVLEAKGHPTACSHPAPRRAEPGERREGTTAWSTPASVTRATGWTPTAVTAIHPRRWPGRRA